MPAVGRSRFLLVDGHSVIFHWDDLRRQHAKNPRLAREELVRRLTAYQDATGERVVLVFDGKGARTTTSRDRPADLQLVYASAGRTADAVIERLVAKYAGEHDLIVATGDEGERLTVSSLGASWIGPAGLLDRIERAERETTRQLKKLRRQ